MIIVSKIAGIPCQIKVTSAVAGSKGRFHGAWEDCYEDEDDEIEFEVLDRRGYPAAWLSRKMTTKDESRIIGEIQSA